MIEFEMMSLSIDIFMPVGIEETAWQWAAYFIDSAIP